MKTRPILFITLGIVIFLAVWQLTTKKDLMSLERIKESWGEITGDSNTTIVVSGEEMAVDQEDTGPPVADPVPGVRPATTDEMFPLPADAPLLESTVELPEKRAPLVYVAFCGNSNDSFTSASQYFGEYYKFQMLSQGNGPLLINGIPNKNLWLPHRRSYVELNKPLPYEAQLADARELGSEYFFYPIYDGGTTDPRVTIKMVDIGSSRTETWSSEQLGLNSPHDIITSAAIASVKFAGLTDDEIQKAQVHVGAPEDSTFAWAVSTPKDEKTFEAYQQIVQSDPECRYTYSEDSGTTWIGQLNEIGLRKFPNDARLLIRKATCLQDAKSSDVLLRYVSELIRRYPDNVFNYFTLAEKMEMVYPCSLNPKVTPPVFETMIKQQQLICRRYPHYYPLAWNRAFALNRLAGHIRGTKTVDRIPDHVMNERLGFVRQAFGIMTELVEKHPDNPSLLRAYIYYDNDLGAFSKADQRSLIRRVASYDPREVDVEIEVASRHSIGYGSPYDYFAVMDHALLSHAGDPDAIKELANALERELYRQVGWKQLTDADARTTGNPYSKRFVEAAEFVYDKGKNLGFSGDWSYYLTVSNLQPEKLKVWERSGQNSYYAVKLAHQAYEAEDWENCIRYVKQALPYINADDEGHLCSYYGIKSLWKLKRYEESLKLSRESIFKFPDKFTFPYIYAVVALDHGSNLETAFDCAWRAMDLDPNDPGGIETFEKLRQKLNKPDHPALAALKN